MKRGLRVIMTAALAAAVLSGCGAEELEPLKDMKVEKYVTLGEYQGLEAEVSPVSVEDASVESLMHSMYDGKVSAENGGITDRAVENGDTVNIDYEGKKDGVAFEGGAARGSLLTIGSGNFIEGFEEGLIGVMPGETVDLELSFPEQYHSQELAGQAVVFTVTVNFILPVQMEDAVVPAIGIENVNTVEQLRQYVYDYLYAEAEKNYSTSVKNEVIRAFMEQCTFENIPEKMIEKYENTARENITAQAEGYGMDADTFTQSFYLMDIESFVTAYAEEAVKQDIAMQAVANRENLNIDDEELNTTLLEYANNAGYDTVEEFIGETPLEDYREYLLYDKVLQYLTDHARITDTEEQ